jgi:serine/threonine protein kinase
VIATHKKSGEIRAVKVISKARFHRHAEDIAHHYQQLHAEIQVMQSMSHPNIITLFDVFESQSELYIVMEACMGGELFDRIKEQGHYTEQDASKVLRQMCEGILYMHTQGIAHCDLKPDNFLFLQKSKDSPLKIIDFG